MTYDENALNIPNGATLDALSLRQLRRVAIACMVKPELVRQANDVPAVLKLLGVPITSTVGAAIEACTGITPEPEPEPTFRPNGDTEVVVDYPNGDVIKVRLLPGGVVEVYAAGYDGSRDRIDIRPVSTNVARIRVGEEW